MVYQKWGRVLARSQRWLLPSVCVACGVSEPSMDRDLCEACLSELPDNAPACRRCGISLSGAIPDLICGACLRRPPKYDASICAFRYAYPVDHFIRALKYGKALAHARVLGDLLAARLRMQVQDWPECFLPVPLSTQRFRERGYNQVIELGRFVERATGIEMRTDLAMRVRHTAEQAGLSQRERRKNLRRAFAVSSSPPKRIAILDDVVTTGSTVNELARVLKRAGGQHVEVWAVARAS